MDEKQKKDIAARLRRDVIQMIHSGKSGHPGGALGVAEIMTSLYFEKLRHDPKKPAWDERDRFVLSNGHVCAVLYAALARTGYFAVEELLTFRRLNSRLQGHPSRHELPGVETSSGPLGQGLSIANGMALALKVRRKNSRVYCLVGDGEIQEGQFWEAVMTSSHYALNNVCLIVNWNGLQIDGKLSDVMGVEPLADKFQSFGWYVQQIDGHSFTEIDAAIRNFELESHRPTVIVAKTLMGKGVSFMENKAAWHGKVPSAEETELALQEIGFSGFQTDLLA